MRQSQDSRVLCEEELLEDPAQVGYAVLDVEDEWQLFSTGDQSKIVSITLEEALVLLPELSLLEFLRPGMVAVAGEAPVTWFVESYEPADLEPDELATWVKDWDLPFAPELACSVSPDLAEVHDLGEPRIRKVYQITRTDPEVWSFFGRYAVDEEEHYPMLLRDVVMLYPAVADALRQHPNSSADLMWDDETGAWLEAAEYDRLHLA